MDDSKQIELPPNVLTSSSFVDVYKNKLYVVRDLYMPDPITGKILFTVSITNLYPGRQTRGHSHAGEVEMCKIDQGRGLMLLNRVSYDVKPNFWIVIPPGVEHKMINYSESDSLVFTHYFPGRLQRPDVKIRGGTLQKVT